jgi:putative colanic acid biosynthesis acetyltransferase WcaF
MEFYNSLITNALWGVYKRVLLRLFGAKIDSTAMIYSSAKIYYPANLTMKAHSVLGPHADCYNVAPVTIGCHATVSQKAYLCTASHDITDPKHRLIIAPITIEEKAWVAADAFVGMGVIVGEGAVVGARASAFKDVEPWTVVGGNPAKFIKNRVLNNDTNQD